MITGLVDGKRSYVIEPGAPLGTSYAMDIARKFGVSFEQIVTVIDEKREASGVLSRQEGPEERFQEET